MDDGSIHNSGRKQHLLKKERISNVLECKASSWEQKSKDGEIEAKGLHPCRIGGGAVKVAVLKIFGNGIQNRKILQHKQI